MTGNTMGYAVAAVAVILLLAAVYIAAVAPATPSTTGEASSPATTGAEEGTPGKATTHLTCSTVTGTGGEQATATSGGSEAVTRTQAAAHIEEPLNYSIDVGGGKVVFIKSYSVSVVNGTVTVNVFLDLPNPCYSATLSYKNGTLVLVLKSPEEGVMCVQMVQPTTVSTQFPLPGVSEVPMEVYKDSTLLATLTITIPA